MITLDEIRAKWAENKPYFEPDYTKIAELRRGTSSRLIRLDVAILALNLYAARIAVRRIPNVYSKLLEAAAGAIIKKLIGVAAKRYPQIQALYDFILLVSQINNMQDLEKTIRADAMHAREGVLKFALSQRKKRKRKTRYVSTRHFIPRQRKKNKSWQST